MSEQNRKFRVFLSAAEPSADAHCAALIRALRSKSSHHNIEIIGIGGEKMQQAGCQLLEVTTTRAAMTYNAFAHILYFYRLIKRLDRYFKQNPTDIIILCDSPAFNFHVAKVAKRYGSKTIFYVAPQLWAWRPGRIRKLRKLCDRLCCILPFEKNWFSERAVEAEFVGNPLFEQIQINPDSDIKHYTHFEPGRARIALMPGSRDAEIKSLWPAMQQIIINLKHKFKKLSVTTVAVDTAKTQLLKELQIKNFESDYLVDSVYQAAKQSDFAIVASGSATLQVAAAGCPMVIMYQSNPLLWHSVGRWLVQTKYLSLVNILAQKELVPEFMPYFTSIRPIIATIEKILEDENKLTTLSSELIKLVLPLSNSEPSIKVADIIIQTLTRNQL